MNTPNMTAEDISRPSSHARSYDVHVCISLKRKGYRQHLVQALAEAASGPLPPSALLPILCAKETGPAAADLVLEVLERITGEEDNISGNGGNGSGGIGSSDESKKAVIGKRA